MAEKFCEFRKVDNNKVVVNMKKFGKFCIYFASGGLDFVEHKLKGVIEVDSFVELPKDWNEVTLEISIKKKG